MFENLQKFLVNLVHSVPVEVQLKELELQHERWKEELKVDTENQRELEKTIDSIITKLIGCIFPSADYHKPEIKVEQIINLPNSTETFEISNEILAKLETLPQGLTFEAILESFPSYNYQWIDYILDDMLKSGMIFLSDDRFVTKLFSKVNNKQRN